MKSRGGLTGKFLLYGLLSLAIALGAVGIIYAYMRTNLSYDGSLHWYQLDTLYVMITDNLIWVAVFILIFLVSFSLFSWRTIARINRVIRAVRQVARGDYTVELTSDGKSELAELEQNVNEMARSVGESFARQKKVEREKDEFITNIAHDLKTPLMSIKGYLTLIMERRPDLETTYSYVKVAHDKAEKLEKQILDLFDLSRLTSGAMRLEKEPINVSRFLLQVQDEAYPMMQKNGMELRLGTLPHELYLKADGMLLARVFDNLLTNATRYAKEGRFVDLECEAVKDVVIFRVVTHANPIPEDQLEHIFDKLYRMEESRSSETGGSGLGLSISRSIVTQHGGSLTARRTQDGTAFVVIMPLSGSESGA